MLNQNNNNWNDHNQNTTQREDKEKKNSISSIDENSQSFNEYILKHILIHPSSCLNRWQQKENVK